MECAVDLAARFMVSHRQVQHGMGWGIKWDSTPHPPCPRLYRVSLTRAAGYVGCPVDGCERRARTHTNLQINFVHRHVQETIVILEEGNRPLPRLSSSNMFLPWA